METETKIKNLVTKEQLLEQSGDLGQITATNVTLGRSSISFVVDTSNVLEGISMSFLRENEKELHRTLLSNTALHHLVREIGMPLVYANNTPDELIVPHLNYWYREKMEGRKIRLLNQNGKTIAISLNPRDEFISLQKLVDTIEQTIKSDNIEGYHNPSFNWDATNINVVLKRNFTVVKDDLLNVGIRFTHSFNELNPTRASAYIFRQWCSNGAVTMDRIQCWSKRMKAESFESGYLRLW